MLFAFPQIIHVIMFVKRLELLLIHQNNIFLYLLLKLFLEEKLLDDLNLSLQVFFG